MKYPSNLFIISMAVFGAYFAHSAIAAQNAPSAFSTYGLIQPVNKYSSNPFWNMDSPYNQRMPVPVYATGADLNTGDCNRVVETLVATYCASHNYCTDSRINDVRPTVMVQLSQLPGHNFATSCGGYIDSVFEKYQKTYGNTSTGTVHYTTTPTAQQTNTVQYQNPLQQKTNSYQTGVMERAAELERLQRATTASPELEPTDFPITTADLSFTDRLANITAGYEPYKDLNPYKTPQFESDEEYYARLKKLNPSEYCKRFPSDVEACSKKIHYELFGGTNAADNPKYYIPGQGATISGVPTRSNSIFISWCTDSALSNCATTQVIDKSENTEKTFFAKWDCTNGYLLQNNTCINPADPNPYINPKPNNCPDVVHMDANCQCTVVPGTSIDPATGMCKCDNGKDIDNNCEDVTSDEELEFIIADCRARQLRNHLIPRRNRNNAIVSDVDSFNSYCINRKEASEKTSACISHCIQNPNDEPNGGAASNLFQETTGLPMCRSGGDPIMSTNIPGTGTIFKMQKKKMDDFIEALRTKGKDSYGTGLQSACTRGNRTSWVLLIDTVKSGVDIPYATVCIGGSECTTGDVTWH